MNTKKNRTISSLWIFLFLAITLDTSSQSYVEGLRTLDKSIFGSKPKGTIKTIEALEVNDIIDCVDIYKQPAFDNPLIKELKMAPSSYQIEFNKTSNPQRKLVQTWHKYGECPTGTIPIKRTSDNDSTILRKYHDARNTHEYATVEQDFTKVNGGRANFNMWNPRVTRIEEFSLAQMWAETEGSNHRDTVEAGWIVCPKLFHDARTRFFIYWSRDNYKKGCYNLRCRGFVQTNHRIALGAILQPISVYGRVSSFINIGLSRSRAGDWWLEIDGHMIGYFPPQLFKTLIYGADRIAFGGEIINLETGGRHTSTAMGSGHFSAEGYGKASYISNIHVMNDRFQWVEPVLKVQTISQPAYYDLTFGPTGTNLGSHFYYGGPGLSPRGRLEKDIV